ncbi:GMC family oxidoreductase [Candidatus Aquiluna sp. UB-MaderosW2red]|uniref:GMC family oxidoreductase n=1 Tax=Candidatus Aquiluna sp. UB-MaderosW2red TaxID=1855377 RepID=UPI000875D11E|nr:GMC family oxidoreductase [Candidatus Aquiluna sp. UB-MaderosW2red]SCX05303.1 Choline dehydrogenase [Candidatus Aquiluna sp. UB-MaderosW2red]
MTESTHTDVIVVGAGLAGSITATELARAGYSVLCLEQGDWPHYGRDGVVHDLESETAAERCWKRDPNDRDNSSDYPIDDSESDVAALMWNGVGGSTVLYLSKWNRMTPGDFRVKSQDGVAEDWPISYEDLEPFYVEVESQLKIGGLSGDPAYPKGEGPLLPPIPLRDFGRLIAKAFNDRGMAWWPGASSVFPGKRRLKSSEMDGAVKMSTDVRLWPEALSLGVELRTHSRVSRVLTEGDRAVGCEYVDRGGKRHSVYADSVILCANGIGTPRILLMSKCEQHPDGLANSSGLVGKRLMMHPFGAVAGVFDHDIESAVSPLGQQLQSMHFYESDPSRGFVRGVKWGLQPTGGPLSLTRSYPWEAANESLWYENFHSTVKRRYNRSAMFSFVGEDLPLESNRVELDEESSDDSGLPGVKIRYRADDNSRALLEWHTREAKEVFLAAGAIDVVAAPMVRQSGWHLMGTAVMGDDPRTSVTDKHGRCHDISNLYIFDSSTWVTSGGLNPVATQAALALWSTRAFIAEGKIHEK